MMLPITSTIAGLLALTMLPLTLQVSMRRALVGKRAGVLSAAAFGDAGDDGLRNAIRAFGNFIEYTPMALILLALAEMNAAPPMLLWILGLAFFAGRVVHAVSMTLAPFNPAPRAVAMLATYAALLVPGGWLLLQVAG